MERRDAELLAELGALLGTSGSRSERAAEILARLRTIVPYDAAAISAAKVGSVEHVTLAKIGYQPAVERHLNRWFVQHDPAYLLMRRSAGAPLRWRDNPFSYRDTYSAREVFIPAGFDEGITVCMHNRAGGYTGSLHLSVADRSQPTDDAVRFLRYLQTMLGELTDLGGAPPPCAVTQANQVTITRSGGQRASEARPLAEELVSQVLAMAEADTLPPWFWWRSSSGRLTLVTTERIGEEITVGETAAEPPYGLTLRELEVLTLVARGDTNVRIGRGLGISPKTVAKHVEHLLEKMGAASRTEAAVRASRVGLVLRSAPRSR